MKVLVTGGTGTVGSAVVHALQARGVKDLSVLTHNPDKVKTLPAGVNGVQGDLGKPADVRRVFNEFDTVFLLNVVSPLESHEGTMAVTGMRIARVKRVVYLSVHHTDKAAWLPHFGAKVGVEEAVKRSGIAYTILRPNNFYQNDYWFKDVLLQYGVYPQPLGSVGLSRVDVRDIADAAAIALTAGGSEHEGQTYDLVGPEIVTGESTAQAWSRALGKTIKYGGDDLDAWEKQALSYMPDFAAFDFRYMYEFFQQQGLKATPEDVAKLSKVLGRPPRAFAAFAQETAEAWQGRAAAR
jgi:uncharacterized protein YbjT (DUF2867 family)